MFDVQLTLTDGRILLLGYACGAKQVQEIYFDYTYGDKASPVIADTAIVPAPTKEDVLCLYVIA